MTTTDPTPLAEQIAREHRFVREGWSSSDCSCDPGGYTYGLAGFAAHIATVTERAVRERATRAVARMNIIGPMRAVFPDPRYRVVLEGLEVLAAQEIETALHTIANGAPDA